MEEKKEELGVLDYSASQPSLESIFLAIAEKDITLDRNRKKQLGYGHWDPWGNPRRGSDRTAAPQARLSPRADSSGIRTAPLVAPAVSL